MSEVKYTELLRSPHWQRKRLETMQRDDFKCRFCGDNESTLNVHHVLYLPGRSPWDYDDDHLVTICEKCHTDEENLKSTDPFLINMLTQTGLSRRKLFCLATALRRHLRYSHMHEEKFQDLMEYLHNT